MTSPAIVLRNPRRSPDTYRVSSHANRSRVQLCVQQKVGQSVGRVLPALRLLQLQRYAQNAAHHPGDGGVIANRVWDLKDLLA